MEMEKKWADLTWEEKREVRFKRWLSPDVKFSSPEAEKNYKKRVTRFIGCPVLMMPLHKGDNSFMSQRQFETFYWPSLKRILMGLIAEGLVPMPFAEGNYEPRLEIIKDMPRTSVVWYFEHMDMKKAKKVLGGTACITGNVPTSLLCTGKPREVKEHCRQLIQTCAGGGGYILTGSAAIDQGDPDNLHAMLAAASQYGSYNTDQD
jgi:uroporphyrinogen-III decarboxylase